MDTDSSTVRVLFVCCCVRVLVTVIVYALVLDLSITGHAAVTSVMFSISAVHILLCSIPLLLLLFVPCSLCVWRLQFVLTSLKATGPAHGPYEAHTGPVRGPNGAHWKFTLIARRDKIQFIYTYNLPPWSPRCCQHTVNLQWAPYGPRMGPVRASCGP